MTTLSALRVLLTRPKNQVLQLADKIANAQGAVYGLPLLAIELVQNRDDVERIKAHILSLENYDIAIFISTNAATLGIDWIDQYWPQLPVRLDAYAVGPGTAAILQQLPWTVYCSTDGVTSEDLLKLPGLQDMEGKRVALFRGQGGRELIATALRARGAVVEYIELYKRTTPHYDPLELLPQLQMFKPNCVVLTSLQIFEAYTKQLSVLESIEDKATGALISLMRSVRMIVPSARVRDIALEQGYENVINAGGADDQTVFNALAACQDEIDQERVKR